MRRLLAAGLALGLMLPLSALGAIPAAGQSEAVAPDRTIDRELVSVRLDADGKITRTSFLDALSVYGSGPVRVTDRNEPKGLRNLIGFQAPSSVSGENLTWDLDVKGVKEVLTVAPDISRTMPVSVTPRYFILGEPVKAEKLRNYTGTVSIEYELKNLTAKTQSFNIKDRFGNRSPVSLETFVPFVAQTSLELPADIWQEIDAPDATIVTDENKIQHVTFTSILAPLIGATTQTARLTARVEDLELGEVRVVFQPLLPAGVEENLVTTAEGTDRLFQGVGQIDTNLGRLQEGTLALVDGLTQLYQGILDARGGLGSVGTDDTIIDGLKQVLDGLEELSDTEAGVPAIKAGVQELIGGLGQVIAGIGTASNPATILGGLTAIDAGLGQLAAGLGTIKAGIDASNAGVGQIAGLIGSAPGAPVPPSASTTASNDVQYLLSAVTGLGLCALPPPTLCDVIGGVQAKLDGARAGLTGQVQPGLSALSDGVQDAIGSIGTPSSGPQTTLRGGMAAVIGGVLQVRSGLKSGNADDPGVLEGLQAVADGLTRVIAGIGSVGTDDTLTGGVDQLFAGSQELASGVDQIASGTSDARAGAGTIGEGQGALSNEGTKVLQAGVGDNVQKASAALAVLGAMKERAANEAFLYGPPEGGTGSSTFVFRVGEITDRNVATLIKFGVGVALALILVGAGAATRRTMA